MLVPVGKGFFQRNSYLSVLCSLWSDDLNNGESSIMQQQWRSNVEGQVEESAVVRASPSWIVGLLLLLSNSQPHSLGIDAGWKNGQASSGFIQTSCKKDGFLSSTVVGSSFVDSKIK